MKKILRLTAVMALIAILSFTLLSCSNTPYDYELDEYIQIGDYTKIKIDEDKVDERAEKLKQELIFANSSKAKEQLFGRALREGDIAIVTYRCYTEDSLIMPVGETNLPDPVLEDTNCEIILGRGKYLPAFESGILNAGVSNQELEWHITIPEDFGIEELRGKNVVFFVTVNSAYEMVKPVYDNVFIQNVTRYSTVEEYETALREQARFQLIWEELIAQTVVTSFPKDAPDEHRLDFLEYYTNLSNAAGLPLEQYVERKFFLDLKNFHLKADEYAKEYTKEEMMVYSIARQNGLELTDDEYQARAAQYAKDYGYDTVSDFESDYGKNFIQYSIMKDSVMRYVTYNSLSSPELLPEPEPEETPEE